MHDDIDDGHDECVLKDCDKDDGKLVALSESDKKVFKEIDRDSEDSMVRRYARTRDPSILEMLYEMRKPTFEIMANRYAYLENESDMYGEFVKVWMNCIKHYQYDPASRPVRMKGGGFVRDRRGRIKTRFKHTPFNTYFFSAMLNCARNIRKRRLNKKRLDGNGDPVADTMMSLDYKYGDGDDVTTMMDMISGSGAEHVRSRLITNDMISRVSGGDKDVEKALHAVAFGHDIRSIKEACQKRSGSLAISTRDYCILIMADRRSLKYLEKMIRATGVFPEKFRILHYVVQGSRVFFNVFVSDPKLCNKVIKIVNKKKKLLLDDAEGRRGVDKARRGAVFSPFSISNN